MSERCPFCQAQLKEKKFSHLNQKMFYDYECGAFFVEDKIYGGRPIVCCETEIANLKAQVQNQAERIEQVEHWLLADAVGASFEAKALTHKNKVLENQVQDLTALIKTINLEMGSGSARGRAIDLLPKKLTDQIQKVSGEV